MNAVDVTARGLARRALDAGMSLMSPQGAAGIGTADGTDLQTAIDQDFEGGVNIEARSEPTAAALEAQSNEFALLTGYAGATHTVETAPYLTRDGLTIRGNGAELRNVSQTPLTGVGDPEQAALPLGVSNVWLTDALTYYDVLSVSGTILNVDAGNGGRFAAGDLVIVRGQTHYFVPGDEYNVYRNCTRARVISATNTTITLDRMLPEELISDGPVIANSAEGIDVGFPGPPAFYMLYAPDIADLTISSDVGGTLQWGGVIDGTFRNLTLNGRNGIVLDAMQDCVFENIRFKAWRKICELAEGSYGTIVRTMRGSLSDAGTKLAGAPDLPPFFIAIGENCAECVLDDLHVNSGPNDTTFNACQISSGRNNEIRNSVLRFPANTGPALAIQANGAAGNGVVDSGYVNVTVHAPLCSRFFIINDLGGGVIRPYFKNCRFFGAPSVSAGMIAGSEGVLENVWCERGALAFYGTPSEWSIRECYFPDGFVGLTDTLFVANDIRDNDSDANRRLRNAATVVVGNTVQITSTTPNNPYQSSTFGAGDLDVGDRLFIHTEASAGGTGNSNRASRLSLAVNGVTVGIGSLIRTANGLPMGYDAELTILADSGSITVIGYRVSAGGTVFEGMTNVGSLTANSLTVTVEYWCGTTADPVNARVCRIIPVKRGMRHLPLR